MAYNRCDNNTLVDVSGLQTLPLILYFWLNFTRFFLAEIGIIWINVIFSSSRNCNFNFLRKKLYSKFIYNICPCLFVCDVNTTGKPGQINFCQKKKWQNKRGMGGNFIAKFIFLLDQITFFPNQVLSQIQFIHHWFFSIQCFAHKVSQITVPIFITTFYWIIYEYFIICVTNVFAE